MREVKPVKKSERVREERMTMPKKAVQKSKRRKKEEAVVFPSLSIHITFQTS